MKIVITIALLAVSIGFTHAQSVGIGTATPNPSAVLHIDAGTSLTNGLLVTGTFNPAATIPDLGGGSRLMFYPGKVAFRAGYAESGLWDNNSVGFFSTGLGSNTLASGNYSTAMGFYTVASGDFSSAGGSYSTASGENSVALGRHTTAKANGSISIGMYNNDTDNPNAYSVPTDRIFQVGNGSLEYGRSNAITVLRSGNTGIGVLEPAYRLDLAGRLRIRSGGAANTSAGIWLNKNDNSGLLGFVGVDGNNDIGIFSSASNWSFLVNTTNGNAWVKGTVTANGVTLTSDERLKKDIVHLGEAMPLLEKLNGYQYHWKDATWDANLQTGLLAQEVEKVLPELVKTDDKGMKSVNYIGLMPYMLEAIKMQQATNATQQLQIEELKKMVENLIKK